MIKEKLKTAVQFTKHLKTSGALYQTSKKVEKAISSKLSDEPNKIYVEFGLGHGNITLEILKIIHPSSKLYSFEVNQDFCRHVASSIDDDRLIIINESAENIQDHIDEPVDGIISSIPMTLFPKKKRIQIIKAAFKALNDGAYFSQILYSTRMKKVFERLFDKVELIKIVSIPMEYVHHCRKHTEN